MHSARQLLSNLRSRPKAHFAIAFVALVNHFSVVGLAAAPAVGVVGQASSPVTSICSHLTGQGKCASTGADTLQLSVPAQSQPCPSSGPGAGCGHNDETKADAGVPSTPAGSGACTAQGPVASLAACSDTVLQLPVSTGAKGGSASAPIVEPSVPNLTPQDATIHGIQLTADRTTVTPGQAVVLTATADAAVTGTGTAIEIFDTTTGTFAGQCLQGSQCAVAYTAHSGVHTFAAFASAPTTTVPNGSSVTSSNRVAVGWVGVSFSAKTGVVGPGQPIIVTATSTIDLDKTGLLLQIYDTSGQTRLTYCAAGNTCSTTLSQPNGGSRSFVAQISASSDTALPAEQVAAQSDTLTVTWLSVAVDAVTNSASAGGVVHIVATANADLTNSPWSIGIFDDGGQLVAPVCKAGNVCTAEVTITDSLPSFKAAVGSPPTAGGGTLNQLLHKVAGPAKLVNIQAQSALVKPTVRTSQMLWGVDSCKSFVDDGLYPHITGILGSPDFWGRYLTDAVCPPLSQAEVAAAHANHMGILPIYNERDCSNVSGYDTGLAYAAEAVASAQAIGIPEGRGIAIDIEPAGPACPGAANLDTGLIHGWYDGITRAHYAPIFYGNTTPGTEFATQWCYTVDALPYIGETSYLWSFQPSLLGGYMKSNAPGYAPNRTGCLGYVHGWQYQIGSSSWAAPDVDGDEVTSDMPIWYP